MDSKHHEWWIAAVVGAFIWILGECIATWMHVQAMKRFSVCPYAAQMGETANRNAQIAELRAKLKELMEAYKK